VSPPTAVRPGATIPLPVADGWEDVREGLAGAGPKRLPARLFYDELGSILFEAITRLPEYGLARADERILRRQVGAIAALVPAPVIVAELGSGSGRKSRCLLEALAARAPVTYAPIDVSAEALARCAAGMAGLPRLTVEPFQADFLAGLREMIRRGRDGRPLLVLFLGSTIGNFERPADTAFLRSLRRLLGPGDRLLLGTDLVQSPERLLAAYDDALGVTAAFNLNLLVRLNRELGADFDTAAFRHLAVWNRERQRIEMHLVARRAQRVTLRRLGIQVSFAEGERLWTESSNKYAPGEPARMAQRAGFEPAAQWIDEEWPCAETLLVAR